ncbi:MAG TPA: tetratricopeptide repeat protein, partial [Vicinamibacteria bacterium]|nr:tetratricopeptide repeat protein [Vicinamibacteria bacterium]
AEDARALLSRGGVHGLKSRLALFRGQHHDAAREAVLMREALLRAKEVDPSSKDVLFGLGLYDYFVDVLPRLAKVIRFFTGMPGGNRVRGLAWIEDARRGALFHRSEALAQLFVIDAFYEKRLDPALAEVRELRGRYPGSPLWGLRLAALECHGLGLYRESTVASQQIVAAAERGEPNYAPIVATMAQVYWGDALLEDLRFAEARSVLLRVKRGDPQASWIGPRAQFLLGRSLELEGDREGAVVHYQAAALSANREERRRAEAALSKSLSMAEVLGTGRLAQARRLREEGRLQEATAAFREALRLWPASEEAALRTAEADLDEGRAEAARGPLERLASAPQPRPPWVKPWSRLLLGRVKDLAGDREGAVREYKEVYENPYGHEELREGAAAGLKRPYVPPRRRDERGEKPYH